RDRPDDRARLFEAARRLPPLLPRVQMCVRRLRAGRARTEILAALLRGRRSGRLARPRLRLDARPRDGGALPGAGPRRMGRSPAPRRLQRRTRPVTRGTALPPSLLRFFRRRTPAHLPGAFLGGPLETSAEPGRALPRHPVERVEILS